MNSKLIFLIRFVLIFGAVNAIIYFLDWNFFNQWIAQIIGNLLGLNIIEGNTFIIQGREIVIANYCNGLTSIGILIGLVLGFSKPSNKSKGKMILVGSIFLLVVNLMRVILVVVSGLVFGISVLEFVHLFSWVILAGVILGFWYWSLKKIGKIEKLSELIE
ncbi:MAG: hypothetical protein Q7S92_04000 [Candidatus Diapherotrites archaeon]|nr:hypothetical protein [Candidatus Diapherotrites archaeon]